MINRTIAVFKSMGTITRCCVCFKRHMGSVAHFAYMFCMSFDIVLLARTTALRCQFIEITLFPISSLPRTMEHRLHALAITSLPHYHIFSLIEKATAGVTLTRLLNQQSDILSRKAKAAFDGHEVGTNYAT